ncbi:uncharacterized protein EI97DRAFT_39893 [Westerdykella ornata]|uniref:Uncharacterized protein n=1 Tax=Westerdykella ornata TaxID=318751 RepID=A0A6A6JIP5_WESOR|nr:uncharacterized protein EI97DRAFT_39893 [Westerdykella ornata]KAF2276441.1 hypothetical protein EI97DRAFT_39893 [Westerdykella ornata]
MSAIRVVARLGFRETDVFHDLVLSLSGNLMSRKDDLHTLPIQVLRDFLVDEISELLAKLCHELGARGDAVAVKSVFLRHFHAFRNGFLSSLFSIECGAESSGALLVHLGSGCDAINRHEEELFRLNLPKQMLDVVEYGNEHLVLCHAEGGRVGVFVSAVMDDAVHVKLRQSNSGIRFSAIS